MKVSAFTAVTVAAMLVTASSTALTLSVAARSYKAGSGSVTTCAANTLGHPESRSLESIVAEQLAERIASWQKGRRSRIAGVSVAIRWDDGRTFESVAGYADRASGRAVTVGTPFALASVSKPFTAAVALLLDACGVLPLDTTAKSLVPKADVDPDATVEDLLRHESGMSDWLTDRYTRMDWLVAHPNAKVGALTAVQGLKPHGPIGQFDYSNSGFTLYTLMAEKATGKSWKSLVQSLLLDPLGLDEISYGPVAGAARPHLWSKGALRPWGSPGWGPTKSVAAVLRGAGDLFGTPRDLARFGSLLWSNRLVEGPRSLEMNGIANITTNGWLYTYGTQVNRYWAGGLRIYGHSGGYSGVTTALRRIPGLGITIAVTANGTEGSNSSADDLAKELFAILDSPSPDPNGVSRATAALSASPEPLDPEPVLVGDGCGATSTSWVAGAKVLNGTGWVSLGPTAGWSGAVEAMAELPDGRLVVAGRGLSRAAGVAVQGIAVRSPRTGSWSSFASLRRADGSAGGASTLAVDAVRGLLYVGGDFASVSAGGSTTKVRGLARFDVRSKRWTALGGGLVARKGVPIEVRSLAIDVASGRLAVGGSFARAGSAVSANVALWRPASLPGATGAAVKEEWRALAGGLSETVEAVAIAPNGAVHAAGHFVGGVVAKYAEGDGMWRIDGDAASFADAPRVLAVDGSGGAIAGMGIAWYGTALATESLGAPGGWVPLGGGVSYPRRSAWISALASLADGRLAVGGYFSAAGGAASPHLAIWDPAAGTFSTLGSGLAIEPDALAGSSRATLYAATRVRSGTPGAPGGRCVAAFAPPAPLAPTNASVTAGSSAATVRWGDPLTGTIPEGWIAVATAKGKATRSCSAVGTTRSCVIKNLAPGVRYSVALRAWVAPAGPSPTITIGSVVAKR